MKHLANATRLVELLPGSVLELAARAARIKEAQSNGAAAVPAAPLVERLSGVVVFSEDDRVADYKVSTPFACFMSELS